jgi:hypothetical protein
MYSCGDFNQPKKQLLKERVLKLDPTQTHWTLSYFSNRMIRAKEQKHGQVQFEFDLNKSSLEKIESKMFVHIIGNYHHELSFNDCHLHGLCDQFQQLEKSALSSNIKNFIKTTF